ncbi:flagellar basal body P-ring formation chaperone FlgA [Thiomicrorhabdus sp. ZW0627]|uniref:flagellar basal body P-ring formation chaperone FlgA n=1 Tax=Thiomicrorhabdus sp. ZW0627 TaxID=3039774 RepID=UPI002436E521|nr:flagellar basal body P-ring formation chaperone FlgA [Thiomicrorhabdus sp. ZW0627]MDG6773381.1 flagellar basal body P-ring formation chaperone FlgA [Thiomicrorhabdus sp. ZW0627]
MDYIKQKTDQKLYDPQIHLKKLSQRIKLPKCGKPIEISDRNPTKYTGRITIGVKCNAPSWQIYVSATIEGKLPVVITTQGILKQAVIKPEDVKRILVPYKKASSNSLISTETAIGMRAKKAIGPNEILSIRDLQPPYLVFKKQTVTIVSKIGGIEVKTKGTALQDGVERQQIEVENNSSKKTVKGIVIAPNTVYVP